MRIITLIPRKRKCVYYDGSNFQKRLITLAFKLIGWKRIATGVSIDGAVLTFEKPPLLPQHQYG
jgi:hypothetical protein